MTTVGLYGIPLLVTFYVLGALVLYGIIRLAVRHALRDAAREGSRPQPPYPPPPQSPPPQ
jgi:hypothetical protein